MGHSAIYDPVADRMLVFGGSTSIYGNAPTNETWQLALADPPAWSLLSPGGTPPSPRLNHVALYDPVRDRMLVIGGANSAQVFSLGLRPTLTWQAIATAGPTPPAFGEELSAIYDPIGDRVLTFSGTSALAVWSLDLFANPPTWTKWTLSGATPPPGLDYSAVYDPIGDRAIVFGLDATPQGGNRTWALEFERPVPALAALVSAEATAEGARVTWLLPGGAGARATVEKRGEGSDWSAVGEIVADGSGLATFRDAQVQAGARYGYRLQLSNSYAAEVWVSVPGFASLQFDGAQPNPACRLSLSFALPAQGGAGAKLSLFDLRGRLVVNRSLDGLGPGTHVLSIPEADGLVSGVYVARLTQGASAVTRRLTILH
jgi:hypothetical protein